MPKPSRKTAAKSAETIPQPHGGALLPGGKKGNKGGGRPADEFQAMCRELASSKQVAEQVKKILASPEDYPKLFVGALKWASEHGYGKPKESVELTGKDGGPIQVQEWTFGKKKVAF